MGLPLGTQGTRPGGVLDKSRGLKTGERARPVFRGEYGLSREGRDPSQSGQSL